MIFDIEGDLGSAILFQKWILEVKIIWKSGITLLSRHISSKGTFSSVSDMLIICLLTIIQIKKFPKVAVVATKLNFLQHTYRIRNNHKTLYSQIFPGPHFGPWTSVVVKRNHTTLTFSSKNKWKCLGIMPTPPTPPPPTDTTNPSPSPLHFTNPWFLNNVAAYRYRWRKPPQACRAQLNMKLCELVPGTCHVVRGTRTPSLCHLPKKEMLRDRFMPFWLMKLYCSGLKVCYFLSLFDFISRWNRV